MPKPSAIPYTIWVFDCPVCGGQTDVGDREPYSDEDCADCGESIWMGSPDWDDDEEGRLMEPFQAEITNLRRMNNTRNGNPRYRIELNGQASHLSRTDAAFTYAVTEGWVGQTVMVTLTDNVISNLELVTPRKDTP